jgi:hypothetical protein
LAAARRTRQVLAQSLLTFWSSAAAAAAAVALSAQLPHQAARVAVALAARVVDTV